jgi:hypothetical protein
MKLTDTQRDQWIEIYQQYRKAGHSPVYAARIATDIVVDGLPF